MTMTVCNAVFVF